MARYISDKEAMDIIAKWFEDMDPVLDAGLPNWVWDLLSILDDLIDTTGRNG